MAEAQLDQAADGLYRAMEALDGDPLRLSKTTQPIALLYTFQAMVDNGGFRYPMENDFPGNPPYSVFSDAYRSIGATDIAETLDKAVTLFPFEKPELNAEGRNAFFESLPENSQFEMLSDLVCGNDRVWQLMSEYVVNHPADFAPYITPNQRPS